MTTAHAAAALQVQRMLRGHIGRRKYMVGGSITLVDIYLLPLLWRLGHHGHRWPKVPALHDYALRLSQRPAFRACLNRREATMSLEAPA